MTVGELKKKLSAFKNNQELSLWGKGYDSQTLTVGDSIIHTFQDQGEAGLSDEEFRSRFGLKGICQD